MRRTATIAAIGSAAVLAAGLVPASAALSTDTTALREAVTLDGVRAHQAALKAIANANGGIRASGTPGYDASADYVQGVLEDAGYSVQQQEFDYEFFVIDADPVLDPPSPDMPAYSPGDEIGVMEYSGAGDVTPEVTPIDLVLPPGAQDNTSTSGCEASDFAGFPAGNIALIQRDT